MERLNDILVNLLKTDSRYFTEEGEILKNAVYEDAMKMDSSLIKLLLSDDTCKARFFTEVDDVLVFDKVGFGWVINNRQFLPDSYTRFKNKIGLTDSNGDFISSTDNVVLTFPYKDCVLEFDSTDENEKRTEIFYNETLCHDDIDHLFNRKVFSNAQRYTVTGIENITAFNDENLIIKGNNLLSLYSLLDKYAGKIKCMYWDILYNTNNDQVPYNDSFKHSSWLTMMKNRLEVAKKLLRNDGLIFIQCDKNEDAYLTVLMDEIFCNDTERSNHVCTITVKSNSISGVKTAHKNKTILKNKDSILVYKKGDVEFKPQYTIKSRWDTHYNSILIVNNQGKIEKQSLKEYLIKQSIIGTNETIDDNALSNPNFKKFVLENAEVICQTVGSIRADKKKESLQNPNTVITWEDNGEKYYAYNGRRISFLSKTIQELNGEKCFVQLLGDLWTDIDFQNTQNEGGVDLPAGKKPEALIKRIIDLCTSEGDIILDAYFGTGTTGAVALKMNRKFIGLEQLNSHYEKSKQRLTEVINGDSSGISSEVNWQGGGSFVSLELKTLNQKFVEAIQSAESDEQLAGVWTEMRESGFISSYVNPKDINAEAEDFNALSFEDKKRLFISILDKNMLYVNYCDIDDESYAISEEDKAFTHSFYKES